MIIASWIYDRHIGIAYKDFRLHFNFLTLFGLLLTCLITDFTGKDIRL